MAPDWLVVGAKVVEFTPSRMGATARIVPTTITKIGKRDVVLANGSRFPVATLRKRTTTWDPAIELLPADEPRIAVARDANRRARLQGDVTRAFDGWRVGRTVEAAKALKAAVDALVEDEA